MNLSTSKTGSSSCQCTTTLHCKEKEILKDVNTIHRQLQKRLVNPGPGSEKKWYGTCPDYPDGSWDKIAENMMTNFSDPGHPIFRACSAFVRGELRSKEHGKKSIHFNGIDENIELLLRTVISANLLSVDGAIAHLCNELSEDLRASGKPEALDHLETMEIPTVPSTEETQTNAQQRKNLVQEYEQKTWNFPSYVLMRV